MKDVMSQLKDREERLLKELRGVRSALKALERVESSTKPSDTALPDAKKVPVGKLAKTRTIKEDTIALLKSYPQGLRARTILEKLNQTIRPTLLRETLSPQLSRLRQEGKLSYHDGKWALHNDKERQNQSS